MLRSLFRCCRTALAWATLLALLSIAWNLKHPPLYKLRAGEATLLLADAAKPAGGQCRHSRRRDRQASKGLRLTS
ncbi:MAG: hypothetical protein NOF05_19810 [Candidatus Accumulibacter phosphatis]|uniref:Uncharacterized protein n=1 Tax=Candidatus Accumulibacter cognatus TaxID=2954383 RepID=A0A7D5S9Y8_9PROT|nr:hypothetical protein [Candidatus Accumulibacter cognatus]MCC2868314.1 hypothetical protein [Candidatus Accumulibacter phosphatis]MCQ1550999.1 hypothetical protein [Candidatus Accumulibacter phosphatis]QLH49940.1 MAG: hypothetical protein HWD57_09210 [Candidatus Accumulibacter cognatus]